MEDLIKGQLIVCLSDHTWHLINFDSVPASEESNVVDYLSENNKLPEIPDAAYIGVYNYELME